jgi:hypothetical protein
MDNVINYLTGSMSSVANGATTGPNTNAQRVFGKWLEEYSRKINAKLFMEELRGDNDNLRLDIAFGSVKDAGSRELAKAA